MDKKKLTSQTLAAIFLYTLFSVILEKDYSLDSIIDELKEGVIFGVIYAVVIWLWDRYKKKK
ncbi:MAG: hypothetical protein JSV59_08555 [Flavobacteriaceae bacterium]|nr:MAG: hypothetical protein JSV59_08555 [Flavobacteriaceae bacterium]